MKERDEHLGDAPPPEVRNALLEAFRQQYR